MARKGEEGGEKEIKGGWGEGMGETIKLLELKFFFSMKTLSMRVMDADHLYNRPYSID